MSNFIGKGEKLVEGILHVLYPHCHIEPQYQLSRMIDAPENWRQAKETLDLSVWIFPPKEQEFVSKPDFVVRIQNKKGGMKMNHEDRQKRELEEVGIKVIDLLWYEHTQVFLERWDYLSFLEVCQELKKADITP